MDYVASILVLAAVYAISAIAENFAFGYSGQFSVAQGAFFGVGAYTWGIATAHAWTQPSALATAALLAAALGALLALIAKDLRGDYFMIVTLAFQMIFVRVALNMPAVTGGSAGIFGVPPIAVFGFRPAHYAAWLLVLVPIVAVVWAAYALIGASRLGLIWKAIREDPGVAMSLGRNAVTYRMLALALSAAGTAFAGCLYAGYITFIDPTQFTLSFSIFIISVLIVGGIANPLGPVAGVLVLTALPEVLRLVPHLPPDIRARLLQVIYAAALLVFVAVRPEGLIPERAGRWSLASRRWRRSSAARPPVLTGEPS